MVLGLIVSDTPDLMEHTFIQKTKLDTSYMVIRPKIFLNGNVVCKHLLLYFIVLISLPASGTQSYSDMGFNETFSSASAPRMWLV